MTIHNPHSVCGLCSNLNPTSNFEYVKSRQCTADHHNITTSIWKIGRCYITPAYVIYKLQWQYTIHIVYCVLSMCIVYCHCSHCSSKQHYCAYVSVWDEYKGRRRQGCTIYPRLHGMVKKNILASATKILGFSSFVIWFS